MNNKYGNQRTTIDNIIFDSKKEAERYLQLKLMQKGGVIRNLELQKRIEILPKLEAIKQGEKAKRAVCYVADFVYEVVATGQVVIEDAKGVRTDVYKLKKRLLRQLHGKIIVEV
ncbi:MAG: DUF1064 domain-containing protein [Firmicutes bacterium]|nr:DUF1064 domain-containing protein [Bacillota bacterium]